MSAVWLSDSNVVLTGYVGPSQLAVARRVAEQLKRPFVNVELRLEEHAGLPMAEVRTLFGEARLKTLETEVVQEVALHRGAVIHVGGQMLLRGDHIKRLHETGPVICLVATLDAVLQRLHLALGARYHDPRERALALGHLKREWAVRHQEHICELDTTGMAEGQIVEAVITLWQDQMELRRIQQAGIS